MLAFKSPPRCRGLDSTNSPPLVHYCSTWSFSDWRRSSRPHVWRITSVQYWHRNAGTHTQHTPTGLTGRTHAHTPFFSHRHSKSLSFLFFLFKPNLNLSGVKWRYYITPYDSTHTLVIAVFVRTLDWLPFIFHHFCPNLNLTSVHGLPLSLSLCRKIWW